MISGPASVQDTRLFLSWAHADELLKEALLALLTPHLKVMKGIRFQWWEDSQLWLGEAWRRDIAGRLHESDYGLLLLSPAFFASDFILSDELPRFVKAPLRKPCLPVGLKRFSLNAETFGMTARQFFLLDDKYFADLDRRGRDRFALGLADGIHRRLTGGSQWRAL
jgi:hypothetical protein